MATSTIKPSGGDYTTLTTWEAAKQGTLAEIETAECYAFSGGLDDKLTINGSVTTASFYFKVTVPSAERHAGVWDITKFGMVPTATGDVIALLDPYSVVEYVQVTPVAGTNANTISVGLGGDSSLIHHNLVDGQESTAAGGIVVTSNTPVGIEIYRNVVWGCRRNNTSVGGIRTATGGTAKIYNNTIYNCVRNLIGGAATDLCINNASFNGSTSNFDGTWDTTNSGWNSTNSASGAPGSNNVYDLTDTTEFTDVGAGTEDFHILTGAGSKDTGTNLGSPYDVDIDGVSVTGTWDIGADEFVAGGGGGLSIPVAMKHYRSLRQ